ncbi:uncharacterized protein B0H64DRAFT_383415 [Chaetomium fimeti]|uniref:Uncharacterized protein n=1 Tax=Chaetomium fimeti TaxID=1854472 RepID=A0AAE0LXQ1_9PEZI|nr:hypothetical protein B0H64DRAFT_383415 [Chaetomium fimeti]
METGARLDWGCRRAVMSYDVAFLGFKFKFVFSLSVLFFLLLIPILVHCIRLWTGFLVACFACLILLICLGACNLEMGIVVWSFCLISAGLHSVAVGLLS